jgi:ribosomal protein S18 acetylase RimI-like enzyme
VIAVRELSPDDWQLWRELRLAALAEAPAAFGSTLAQWSGAGDTEQRWRDRLASVARNVVITWAGAPAGMVSAAVDDDAVELISMWVSPSARGRGVGDAAMRAVLDWAAAEHRGTPVVLSVKAHNAPAVNLYRRHGFIDAGPSADDPTERVMRWHRPAQH